MVCRDTRAEEQWAVLRMRITSRAYIPEIILRPVQINRRKNYPLTFSSNFRLPYHFRSAKIVRTAKYEESVAGAFFAWEYAKQNEYIA